MLNNSLIRLVDIVLISMLYSLKFNLGMTFKREEKKSQRRKEGKFYGAVTSEREAQIGFFGGEGVEK